MNEVPQWFSDMWRQTALCVEGTYGHENARGWTRRMRPRDFWTYGVVINGSVQMRQGAWNTEMVAGDQAILLPNHVFWMSVLSDRATWVTVDFRVLVTTSGADPLPMLSLPAVVHTDPNAAWRESCRNIVTVCGDRWRARQSVFEARGLVDAMIGRYLKMGIESGSIAATQRSPVPDWLSMVRTNLSQSGVFSDRDLTSAKMAKTAGYSQAYFCRTFRRVFGATPMETLWDIRLGLAARKLDTEQSTPVGEVGMACGFRTHTHFTQRFRRHFGMTPTAWRKRNLRG
jgi:AraC-like DNA-binding protein